MISESDKGDGTRGGRKRGEGGRGEETPPLAAAIQDAACRAESRSQERALQPSWPPSSPRPAPIPCQVTDAEEQKGRQQEWEKR